MNQRIIAALSFDIPCVPDIYTGTATEYLTFRYNTIPSDFGDDAPTHERYFVQVHYVCPVRHNGTARRKAIKKALLATGFTFPSETNVSDAEGQHYVYECEIAGGV